MASDGPSRLSADLIVQARRTAGLTQHQLAERLGRDQSTIARWERAHNVPSMETLAAVLRACGRDLSIRLTTRDDSYDRLIARQLAMTPAARLADRAPAGYSPAETLAALASAGVELVVIGAAAAALHGSPLALGDRELEIVPAPTGREQLATALAGLGAIAEPSQTTYGPLHPRHPYLLPDGQRVTIVEQPAGTRGCGDLLADAALLEVDERGTRVPVASVIDLLRIADRSPWDRDQINRPALRAVSQAVFQRDNAAAPAPVDVRQAA